MPHLRLYLVPIATRKRAVTKKAISNAPPTPTITQTHTGSADPAGTGGV